MALLRPITKGAWSVAETRQIPEVLTTAIRVALSGRPGPVFVEIPVDLLLTTIEDRLAPIPTDYVHRTPVAGDPPAIERLAALLAGASRPVVMARRRRVLGRRGGSAGGVRRGRRRCRCS